MFIAIEQMYCMKMQEKKTVLFAEKKYLIYKNLSCSKLHFLKRLIQEIHFTFI